MDPTPCPMCHVEIDIEGIPPREDFVCGACGFTLKLRPDGGILSLSRQTRSQRVAPQVRGGRRRSPRRDRSARRPARLADPFALTRQERVQRFWAFLGSAGAGVLLVLLASVFPKGTFQNVLLVIGFVVLCFSIVPMNEALKGRKTKYSR